MENLESKDRSTATGPGDYGGIVEDYLDRAGRVTDDFAAAMRKQVEVMDALVREVREGNLAALGDSGAAAAKDPAPTSAGRSEHRGRGGRNPGIFD